MSKYTKDEQTKIVGWAMNLEVAIQSEKAELSTLRMMRFRNKPDPPTHSTITQTVKKIKPNYPKAPQVSFSTYMKNDTSTIGKLLTIKYIKIAIITFIGLLIVSSIFMGIGIKVHFLSLLGIMMNTLASFIIPAYIILFFIKFFDFLKNRKELNNNLAANTPEYLRAYNEAERIAQENEKALAEDIRIKQEKLDLLYTKEKEKYENEILPQYNKELYDWQASQNMKINVLTEDLNANQETLETLYLDTKIIPAKYRTPKSLTWIYMDMDTSEHDIERAIDMLNEDIKQKDAKEIIEKIEHLRLDMMQGFKYVYSAIEEGNEIALENNTMLGKIRRDINIGNAVATAQRHSINKQVKTMNEKFE